MIFINLLKNDNESGHMKLRASARFIRIFLSEPLISDGKMKK